MGVNLAKKGFAMMVYKDDAATELRPWWGDDSLALAAFGFTFLSFFLRCPQTCSGRKTHPCKAR